MPILQEPSLDQPTEDCDSKSIQDQGSYVPRGESVDKAADELASGREERAQSWGRS